MANFNLALPFWQFCRDQPERLAIAGESQLTYGQAGALASRIAGWIPEGPGRRVVVLGSRSVEGYLGVLAAAWAGATFIPLSLKFPEERLVAVLRQAQPDVLLVDSRGLELLSPAVLAAAPERILYPGPEAQAGRVLGLEDLAPGGDLLPIPVGPEETGHIIFTSGTTGVSKGVMVAAASVVNLVEKMQERWQLLPSDRVTGGFELSFDAAIFDMFFAWNAGASLHVVPPEQAMAPAQFLRSSAVTVTHFVASVAAFLQAIRALQPGAFPAVRYSLFGGEAVPMSAVAAWRVAAPHSTIATTYGPTEASIFCMLHTLTEPPIFTPERNVMALGRALGGAEAAIVDGSQNFLPAGAEGELALAGIPVALGYLDNPELTASRFPILDGKRYYLTGDRAYQDANGVFHHLGRTDNQVKILGNRIELEEVETSLRAITGQTQVAVVVWPLRFGSAAGIVGFVSGFELSPEEIRDRLRQSLPAYSVPSRIVCLDALPLNANGKVDRAALVSLLEGQ